MFWDNFVILCNKKGKSPNGACAELGFSKNPAKYLGGAFLYNPKAVHNLLGAVPNV